MAKLDNDKPASQRISVPEFRGTLTSVLKQARQGHTFLVIARDELLAEIHPTSAAFRPRHQPGRSRGKIRMAREFDDLPDMLTPLEDKLG